MRKLAYLVIVLAVLGIIVVLMTIDLDTTEKVTSQDLRDMDIEFTPETFIKYVQNDDLKTVEMFLQAGMNPDIKLTDGRTPVLVAAAFQSKIVLPRLTELGINVNTVFQNEITPLMACLVGEVALKNTKNQPKLSSENVKSSGDTTILKNLLKAGADPNINSYSLVMLSISQALNSNGDLSVLRILLKSGLNVNVHPEWAKPALQLGMQGMLFGLSPQVVRLFVEAGANVNEKYIDPKNRNNSITALELANSQSFQQGVGPQASKMVLDILENAK